MLVHLSKRGLTALNRAEAHEVVALCFLLYRVHIFQMCWQSLVRSAHRHVGTVEGVLSAFRWDEVASVEAFVTFFDLIEHVALGDQVLFIAHSPLPTALIKVLTTTPHYFLVIIISCRCRLGKCFAPHQVVEFDLALVTAAHGALGLNLIIVLIVSLDAFLKIS